MATLSHSLHHVLLDVINSDGAEVAAEATDFFDSMEKSSVELEIPSGTSSEPHLDSLSRSMSSNSQQDQYWDEKTSMGSLRLLIASKDGPLDLKTVPKMSQPHFIELWQTLNDMFPTHPDDQDAYRSIAEMCMLNFLNLLTFLIFFNQ